MTDTYGTFDPADRPGRKAATPQDQPTLKAEDGSELPAFDRRYSEAFQGLTYVGSLTHRFDWLGHEFVIRTLGVDEQLAYAAAVVAMAVVTVDGEELPSPIGEDQLLAEWAHKRFGYVKANWFQPTINFVWQEYLQLEDKVAQVIEAMGKAFGPAA